MTLRIWRRTKKYWRAPAVIANTSPQNNMKRDWKSSKGLKSAIYEDPRLFGMSEAHDRLIDLAYPLLYIFWDMMSSMQERFMQFLCSIEGIMEQQSLRWLDIYYLSLKWGIEKGGNMNIRISSSILHIGKSNVVGMYDVWIDSIHWRRASEVPR